MSDGNGMGASKERLIAIRQTKRDEAGNVIRQWTTLEVRIAPRNSRGRKCGSIYTMPGHPTAREILAQGYAVAGVAYGLYP